MTKLGLTLVAIAALTVPGIALAQVRGGEQIGRGGAYPLPQDIRPIGFQQHRYASGYEDTAHFEADQCKRAGCIIVVNKSATLDVTQFFINDGKIDTRGVPDWGADQFQGFRLEPSRAVWTVRPNKMKCETVVRVVLRDPKSGEETEAIRRLDMCSMRKSGFAILEIQGNGPRVILEPGTATGG